MTTREDRDLPNATLYVLFKAIEEVMGEKGFHAMLNASGLQHYIQNPPPNNLDRDVHFSDYARLQKAVIDFYGPRGARAVLSQIGRVLFRYTLEQQPAILGLAGLALKMLPEQAKAKTIINRIAAASAERTNMPSRVEEDDEAWYLIIEECPCAFREKTPTGPSCFTSVGTIAEALRWATGKHYLVTEIECINQGDATCTYRIAKKPQSD
ncbi:hypothetical protein ARMA_2534 [Ardenticatena maritima]|uniref:4-vinyl reductase 4VR domain-containing protein n=1 Tax=Ardenticatena maritima TaxID=872965 RepID=A0A0M8KAA5_9CHLR|nr:V4R domain-containing protein [Ardenticatena maritima]KPL86432.1 hypothetical protein SE16_14125 [Ardenticatena maritima]GAP64111.1 hypothetical protein ARMA_2534 [Ardenticatena maritima]